MSRSTYNTKQVMCRFVAIMPKFFGKQRLLVNCCHIYTWERKKRKSMRRVSAFPLEKYWNSFVIHILFNCCVFWNEPKNQSHTLMRAYALYVVRRVTKSHFVFRSIQISGRCADSTLDVCMQKSWPLTILEYATFFSQIYFKYYL